MPVHNATELLSSTPEWLPRSMEAGGENIRNRGQNLGTDIVNRFPAAPSAFAAEDKDVSGFASW